MPSIPLLSSFFGSSASASGKMSYPEERTPDEWRAILSPGMCLNPLRTSRRTSIARANADNFRTIPCPAEEGHRAGRDREYDKHYPDEGVYACAGCNAPLYKANHKFKSGCGWPAYFDSIPGAVTRHEDRSFGMSRIEIVCSNCGGHLGHVFKGEGYATPTDERQLA